MLVVCPQCKKVIGRKNKIASLCWCEHQIYPGSLPKAGVQQEVRLAISQIIFKQASARYKIYFPQNVPDTLLFE